MPVSSSLKRLTSPGAGRLCPGVSNPKVILVLSDRTLGCGSA
jgi:hypothetical protein